MAPEPAPASKLVVLKLTDMKAYSSLAEVQALTEDTLAPLEAVGIDLLEAELGRQITLDSANKLVRLQGSGMAIVPLPERLDTLLAVVSDTMGDITPQVEVTADGWLLRSVHQYLGDFEYYLYAQDRRGFQLGFRHPINITGKWGWKCSDQVTRVLMDICEALAVRKGDGVSRRDELAPWGTMRDGDLSADRDGAHRVATLENLLRYDVKIRLRGAYRPSIVEVV